MRCGWNTAYFSKKRSIQVVVAVDDLTLASNSAHLCETKVQLNTEFEMTDMGDIHWLLGIEVKHDCWEHMISLSQHAYFDTILTWFNVMDANAESVPMEPGIHLSCHQSLSADAKRVEMAGMPYNEAIGSLMYTTLGTCPDIAFATETMSQFIQDPWKVH